MGRVEDVERGWRAFRASWRMEIEDEELDIASRILAGLPRCSPAPSEVLRVAAAGRELLSLRHLVLRTRQMVRDGELPLGSEREEPLLGDLLRGTTELITAIEAHFGRYPDADAPPDQRSGVRETFLVEVDPEHHSNARWLVDLAHRATDAPEPREPVGRMMLRAFAEDLREVERFLIDASGAMDGALCDLTTKVQIGCGELAGAIEELLPPAPGAPAPDGEPVGTGASR